MAKKPKKKTKLKLRKGKVRKTMPPVQKSMEKNMIIKAECSDCGASGLFRGMCEPEGIAVICTRCEGEGYLNLNITEFTRRKGKRGIHTIRLPWGRGTSITYQEFQAGKRPREK